MIERGRANVLGVMVDAMDYEAAVEHIARAAAQREPLAVTALAVHGVMTGVLDPDQRYRLNHLDRVLPDGQPVRWALNWLHGAQLPDRVYGPTLMLKVCGRAAADGLPIYLYGSSAATVEALSARLCERFPGLVIAGARPSAFRQLSPAEAREVAEAVRASGAAITFVGLGCPRQEVWAYEYRDALSMPIIAVGAAFDFHAGNVPQAPHRLQRIGLEWFYRFLHEPRRLWRRYVLLNPTYLWLLLMQKIGLWKPDPASAAQPSTELRYG